MKILDKIVRDKKEELKDLKELISYKNLENSRFFNRTTYSLRDCILNGSGIISEFKRKSPSKGVINNSSSITNVTKSYEIAGVSGISILTNQHYFGGTIEDIKVVRDDIKTPILRKEFIVDEFQIIEAKSIGADAILLIASILTKEEIKQFSELAKSLNLDILFEIHTRDELDKLNPSIGIVGVNNRNLKTFEVDINNSLILSEYIPDSMVKVSESGISQIRSINLLKEFGYKGFLIGESFMKTENPGAACKEFLDSI